MSFSDDIIQNKLDDVILAIQRGQNLNTIDEYGYTPLIQAAIHNHNRIASILLKQGVDTNAIDVSGQTALHWAIDNDNQALVELLIQYKADPNLYTQDGQPPLFKPLLRKNTAMRDYLIKMGADLKFAEDYINAKLIGHRFELKGFTDVYTTSGVFIDIDMEGFYLEFSMGLIQESLEKFINSYTAHRLKLPLNELQTIIHSLENASQLRVYKHYNQKVEDHIEKAQKLLSLDLLLLPVSYRGHAITFIKQEALWAKCDRGVQKSTDPIVVYKVHKPDALNFEFYKNLLYRRQTEKTIKQDLHLILGLEPYAKIPIQHQVTGNCSWANVEASVPTMLFMLLLKHLKNEKNLGVLLKNIAKIHEAWLEWDKDRALEDCLLSFQEANLNRRKAKATLLGSVLFQACDYRKPRDIARAKKILAVLMQKEFRYIIKAYVDVFIKGGKGAIAKNFHEILKICHIKLTDFG